MSRSRSKSPEKKKKKKSRFTDTPPEGFNAFSQLQALGGAANILQQATGGPGPGSAPGPGAGGLPGFGGMGMPGMPGMPNLAGLGMPMMGGQIALGQTLLSGGVDPNTKSSRELYIGNMPPRIQPGQLQEFLNTAMKQGNLTQAPGDPVIECRCSEKFAFAAFRSIEEATEGLKMDQVKLLGYPLKIGRPKAYTGQHSIATPWAGGEVTVASLQGVKVLDPDTKVQRELYLGNMPQVGVSQVMLTEFFNAAMTQAGLTTQPGNPVVEARISDKFAFVQFRTIEETNNALGLDGIMFMGSQLKIGRPKAYIGIIDTPTAASLSVGLGLGGLGALGGLGGLGLGGLGGMGALGGVAAPAAAEVVPTKVLRMSNMVSRAELLDPEEYGEIMEDVVEEMEKFGEVERTEIPRPAADQASDPVGVGLVFVKFAQVDTAKIAIESLRSRTFGGKYLGLSYFPEAQFDAEDYSEPKAESAAPPAAPADPAAAPAAPAAPLQ